MFKRKLYLRNVVKTVACLAITSMLFLACSKDDMDSISDDIHDIIPEAISEVFREFMPVYSGTTPPDISGEYLCTPYIRKISSILAEKPDYVGDDLYFAFEKAKNGKYSYSEKRKNSLDGSDGASVTVVGEGNWFTAYYTTSGLFGGFQNKRATIISGELTPEGISDFHFAYIMFNKTPIVPANTFSVHIDGDGLAERNNWTSK